MSASLGVGSGLVFDGVEAPAGPARGARAGPFVARQLPPPADRPVRDRCAKLGAGSRARSRTRTPW